MELTLEQALAGHATKIKGKEYYSTAAYIEPFLERMSKFTTDFRIQGVMAPQISLTSEGEVDVDNAVWNRMWVQAVMPDEAGYDEHDRVVGMVFGLDIRKPVVKFYTGGLNRACTNLCIFSPSFLNVQELEPEKAVDYRPIDRIMQQTSDVKAKLELMANIEVPYKEELIDKNLGLWVRNTLNMSYGNQYGKVKVATSTAIDAYKLLYETEDSPYYVGVGNPTDMFNIYNAWTQILTNDTKDVINKAEKTILVSNILGM